MVHWPDNMVTYYGSEKILFSNDAFGQHIASAERFDDQLPLDIILEEAQKYYANIVLPYGKQVQMALEVASELDIEVIAPSHGLIWRTHIPEIIDRYNGWSKNKTEEKAVVVYDSMWGSTAELAETIEKTFTSAGINAKKINLEKTHISDVMTDLLTARYIAVGSSTLNNNMLPSVSGFLTYMRGLAPENRLGLAFGSYGWSGESVVQIMDVLTDCGFKLLPEIKVQYRPSDKMLENAAEDLKESLEQNLSEDEKEKEKAQKYRCETCGYIYNPEKGDPEGDIKPGTSFEDLPDDWVCPICGASKDLFLAVD